MHATIRRALLVATVTISLLIASGVGHATGTPAQVCAGAKMKAAGKSAGQKLACHAKAARRGATVDSTCLAKATTKLSDAFTKAESHGGCNTTDDADDITNRIDSSVGAFVAALRPTTPANRCAGSKLKATGKKAKTKLGCHATATRKGVAVDPQCLGKAEARFASTFSSAEAHGPCLTTNDADGIESQVDDLVSQLVAALPSNTTTTTVPGPVCGNGVVEGGEQCDTNPQAICIASGRSGCFPSGNPNLPECKCCTMPGETGQVDVGGGNECCDGSLPQPAGPGAFVCQGTSTTTMMTTTTITNPTCLEHGTYGCHLLPAPCCDPDLCESTLIVGSVGSFCSSCIDDFDSHGGLTVGCTTDADCCTAGNKCFRCGNFGGFCAPPGQDGCAPAGLPCCHPDFGPPTVCCNGGGGACDSGACP